MSAILLSPPPNRTVFFFPSSDKFEETGCKIISSDGIAQGILQASRTPTYGIESANSFLSSRGSEFPPPSRRSLGATTKPLPLSRCSPSLVKPSSPLILHSSSYPSLSTIVSPLENWSTVELQFSGQGKWR